jgi:hypothetical protein
MEGGAPGSIAGSFLIVNTYLKDAARGNAEAARSGEVVWNDAAVWSGDVH